MNKKRNKKHSFRDRDRKISNPNDVYKNYSKDEEHKPKYSNDVRVVSTNIIKENKDVKVKNKSIANNSNKSNYRPVKKEEFNKPYYNKPKNKKYQRSISDIKRRELIQKEIQSYQFSISQDKKECPKCNKRIDYISNSIYDKNKDEYYHFDCVFSEIKKDMLIKPNQRLVYLGSGAFGLIEDSGEHGSSKFIIKKKIQYTQDLAAS